MVSSSFCKHWAFVLATDLNWADRRSIEQRASPGPPALLVGPSDFGTSTRDPDKKLDLPSGIAHLG